MKDYYVAYFDGACEKTNPNGNLGIGSFVLDKERKMIFRYSKFISQREMPKNSNNVAEYMAFISVLEYFIENNLQNEKIIVCGDSQLVIRQMTREYGCNGGIYEPYYHKALKLCGKFTNISFEWVRREFNTIADDLSKQALIENGIVPTERKRK